MICFFLISSLMHSFRRVNEGKALSKCWKVRHLKQVLLYEKFMDRRNVPAEWLALGLGFKSWPVYRLF